MKLSLFENDKSTMLDEIIFTIFTLIIGGIGLALIINKPSFWIIDGASSASFGVIMVLFAVMFIPGLIYRFATNDKKDKNAK